MKNEYPIAYAAYNADLDIRLNSTSGGIFTVLADYFIDRNNAIVYGASFDEKFQVKHIRIDANHDIGKLRGSKYPQSALNETFSEVKNDLQKGKTVFFTGTPCQVYGLKMFLNGACNDQLFTMDFVCHGVASPLIWNEYIHEVSKKGDIEKIIFKGKPHGWKKWYFQIFFKNGDLKQVRGKMDCFMRSYLNYSNIRPSCYECRFKGLFRISDFTISDCWGIGEENKTLNDDKGLSALLIQNDRARVIFEDIKDKLKYTKYDTNILMNGNWTAYRSVSPNNERDRFFNMVKTEGAMCALNSIYKPTIWSWVKYYIDRVLGNEK